MARSSSSAKTSAFAKGYGEQVGGQVVGAARRHLGEARRQRAAAESSLTDRINLSVAEAFVNGGSLTSVEPIHLSRRAQICAGCSFLRRDFIADGIRGHGGANAPTLALSS
jgi:hypothetical protein